MFVATDTVIKVDYVNCACTVLNTIMHILMLDENAVLGDCSTADELQEKSTSQGNFIVNNSTNILCYKYFTNIVST